MRNEKKAAINWLEGMLNLIKESDEVTFKGESFTGSTQQLSDDETWPENVRTGHFSGKFEFEAYSLKRDDRHESKHLKKS